MIPVSCQHSSTPHYPECKKSSDRKWMDGWVDSTPLTFKEVFHISISRVCPVWDLSCLARLKKYTTLVLNRNRNLFSKYPAHSSHPLSHSLTSHISHVDLKASHTTHVPLQAGPVAAACQWHANLGLSEEPWTDCPTDTFERWVRRRRFLHKHRRGGSKKVRLVPRRPVGHWDSRRKLDTKLGKK